jgi:flagellum-specific peptidoglycan hydrolase FlgJ
MGAIFEAKEKVLAELKKQQIPHANIVLAQSRLETGNYTSKVCKNKNNLFGIRKGNKYKSYNSWKESISDYKRLISSRYKNGDYYQFLERIKYAEDKMYIQSLKEIV